MRAYTVDQIALAIIAEGVRRGITARGIQIALATGLVESGLAVLTNPADSASYHFPNDGEGHDGSSTGVFQQQNNGAWGTIVDRMDPALSAGMFYAQLVKFDYNDLSRSPGSYAQDVQRSGNPGAYDQHWSQAVALYNRLAGSSAVWNTFNKKLDGNV